MHGGSLPGGREEAPGRGLPAINLNQVQILCHNDSIFIRVPPENNAQCQYLTGNTRFFVFRAGILRAPKAVAREFAGWGEELEQFYYF